ncbi:tail fiber domain-containing protein [Halobacteriovorax sp. RZ-1]|uniref:tail fiber domain-containing protein n=1 Tax=unclassified Halobacteriovorax TaxID=2639665 RepID=UPI00371A88EC
MYVSRKLTFILAICLGLFLNLSAIASTTKLGYSGRLVQTNGTPVTGTPDLKFDLYYSGSIGVNRGTETINAVPLSNGIYTVELDFSGIATVIDGIPTNETLVIQVTDITDAMNPVVYDFQNILATPISVYANHAAVAENLVVAATCSPGQVVSVNASNELECVDQTAAVAVDSTLVNNAGVIGLPTVVTGDTYYSVTVDDYGRVTGGSTTPPSTTASDIQDNLIVDADINTNAAISWSKINKTGATPNDVGLTVNSAGPLGTTSAVATENIVKTYVDTTAGAIADAKVIDDMSGVQTTIAPSVNAVKTYVTSQTGGITSSQWTDSGLDIYFNTGYVGVGTNTPMGPLHVVGSANDLSVMRFGATDADISSLTNLSNMSGLLIANEGVNNAYHSLRIVSDVDATQIESLAVTNAGRVGIGVLAPTQKLDVDGNIKATGVCIGADCRTAWPTGNAGTVTSVTGGTGLTGGTITSSGTLAVDVGTTNGKIAQVGAGDKLADSIINYNPAIDVALTGFSTGAASSVVATDTILQAFAKVQGQLDAHATSIAGNSTLVINSTAGNETGQAASVDAMKNYVTTEIAGVNQSQWTNSASDIYFDSGRVGIGTTSPISPLTVNGVITAGGLNSSGAITYNSSGNYVPFSASNSTGYAHARINGLEVGGITSSTNEGYIKLGDNSRRIKLDTSGIIFSNGITASDEVMRISSNGNVGIGTTNPSEMLEVVGRVKGTELCIGGDCRTSWPTGSGGTVTSVAAGTGLTGGTITSTGTLAVDVGTTNGKIAQVGAGDKLADSIINYNPAVDVALTGFSTGAASSVAATDTILEAFGKVQGQLNAHSTSIAANSNLVINSMAGTEMGQAPSVSSIKTYVDDRATQWATSGSDISYTGGNVGIGTASPSVPLEVNGVARINGVYHKAYSWRPMINGTDNFIFKTANMTNGGESWAEITISDGQDLAIVTYGITVKNNGGINTTAIKVLSGSTTDIGIKLRYSNLDSAPGTTVFFLTATEGKSHGQHVALRGKWVDFTTTTDYTTLTDVQLGSQLIIADNGSVGVGTTTPSEKLEVSGNVKATAFIGDGSSLTGVNSSSSSNIADNTISADTDVNGTGAINFETGGTTKMTVDNSGNVGIGTSTPGALLNIASTAPTFRLTDTDQGGTNEHLVVAMDSGNATFDVSDAGAGSSMILQGDGDVILAESVGKVGIGTASPLGDLHVKGDEGNVIISGTNGEGEYSNIQSNNHANLLIGSNLRISETGAGHDLEVSQTHATMSGAGITIGGNTNAGDFIDSGVVSVYSTKGSVTENDDFTAAPTAVFRHGKVGIGTTNPVGLLHLEKSDAPVLRVTRGGVLNALLGDLGVTNNGQLNLYDSTGTLGSVISSGGSSYLLGGNVGIGTNSPIQPLHVQSTSNIPLVVESTDAVARIELKDPTSSNAIVTSGGAMQFTTNGTTSSDVKMTIDSTGNVGIGTTTPEVALDVSGVVKGAEFRGRIDSTDTRDDVTTPETIDSGVVYDFKRNVTNGLSDGGAYNGVMTFRSYGSASDWSGGPSHQLGFTTNGNLFHRYGSNTTWNNWRRLIEEDASGNIAMGKTTARTTLDVGTDGNVAIFGDSSLDDKYISIRDNNQGLYMGLDVSLNSGNGAGLIQSGQSKALAFKANTATFGDNDPDLYIDESGKIGMGTTAPSARLSIQQSGVADNYEGIRLIADKNSDGTNDEYLDVYIDSAGKKIIQTQSSGAAVHDLLLNPAIGNVGIGTTAPTDKLHVAGDLRVDGQILGKQRYVETITFADGWAEGDYIEVVQAAPIAAGAATGWSVNISGTRGNWTESHLYEFATGHSDDSPWQEILHRSEAGYGSNGKCFTLDVNGNGNSPQFRVRAIKASASCGLSSAFPLVVVIEAKTNINSWTNLSSTGNDLTVTELQSHALSFNVVTGRPEDTAGKIAIHANEQGYVGVGTKSADAPLRVHGQSTSTTWPTDTTHGDVVAKFTNHNNGLEIGVAGTLNARRSWILARHSSVDVYGTNFSTLHLQPDIGTDTNYRGVGIGLDPGTHLALNGERLVVNGTAAKPGGGSWATYSDARLKDLTGEFTYGLDAIMAIDTIKYRYKDNNALGILNEREHSGFIAQDIQKVIPEAVRKTTDDYLTVDNDPIFLALINATKEQQTQLDENKRMLNLMQEGISRRVASLEEQVETLKEENEVLKAYLCQKDPDMPLCPKN